MSNCEKRLTIQGLIDNIQRVDYLMWRGKPMAVQKSKKSRRVRDNGRAHHHMDLTTISTDSASGESHVRHHISANGYYKGKKVTKAQDS